jgi:hypothetical protein
MTAENEPQCPRRQFPSAVALQGSNLLLLSLRIRDDPEVERQLLIRPAPQVRCAANTSCLVALCLSTNRVACCSFELTIPRGADIAVYGGDPGGAYTQTNVCATHSSMTQWFDGPMAQWLNESISSWPSDVDNLSLDKLASFW